MLFYVIYLVIVFIRYSDRLIIVFIFRYVE